VDITQDHPIATVSLQNSEPGCAGREVTSGNPTCRADVPAAQGPTAGPGQARLLPDARVRYDLHDTSRV
jgi:hypothetical protein